MPSISPLDNVCEQFPSPSIPPMFSLSVEAIPCSALNPLLLAMELGLLLIEICLPTPSKTEAWKLFFCSIFSASTSPLPFRASQVVFLNCDELTVIGFSGSLLHAVPLRPTYFSSAFFLPSLNSVSAPFPLHPRQHSMSSSNERVINLMIYVYPCLNNYVEDKNPTYTFQFIMEH